MWKSTSIQPYLQIPPSQTSLQNLLRRAYLVNDAYFADQPEHRMRLYLTNLWKELKCVDGWYPNHTSSTPTTLLLPTNLFDCQQYRLLVGVLDLSSVHNYEPVHEAKAAYAMDHEPSRQDSLVWKTQDDLASLGCHPQLVSFGDASLPHRFVRTIELAPHVFAPSVLQQWKHASSRKEEEKDGLHLQTEAKEEEFRMLTRACQSAVCRAFLHPSLGRVGWVSGCGALLLLPLSLSNPRQTDAPAQMCLGLEIVSTPKGSTVYQVKALLSLEQAQLAARLIDPIDSSHWLFALPSGHDAYVSTLWSWMWTGVDTIVDTIVDTNVDIPQQEDSRKQEKDSREREEDVCSTFEEKQTEEEEEGRKPTETTASEKEQEQEKEKEEASSDALVLTPVVWNVQESKTFHKKKKESNAANKKMTVLVLKLPPSLQQQEHTTIVRCVQKSFAAVCTVRQVRVFVMPDKKEPKHSFYSALIDGDNWKPYLVPHLLSDAGQGRDPFLCLPVANNAGEEEEVFRFRLYTTALRKWNRVKPILRPLCKTLLVNFVRETQPVPILSFFQHFQKWKGEPFQMARALVVHESGGVPQLDALSLLKLCEPELVCVDKKYVFVRVVAEEGEEEQEQLVLSSSSPFPFCTPEELRDGWYVDPRVEQQILQCIQAQPTHMIRVSEFPLLYSLFTKTKLEYSSVILPKTPQESVSRTFHLQNLLELLHPRIRLVRNQKGLHMCLDHSNPFACLETNDSEC